MKKKRIFIIAMVVILLVGIIWLIWSNVTVGLTKYEIYEENLPAVFDGYRIVHISDLHNSWLWEKAIDQIEIAKPDIICITGDLIDSDQTENALLFVEKAILIAPCYYITGNHETMIDNTLYLQMIQELQVLGVSVLMNQSVILSRGDGEICLTGHAWGKTEDIGQLTAYDGYRVLLSHQPEGFANYAAGAYDLVLSGHAHGGQFRLPLIGGLYAPGQGILPEYDSGVYTQGRTDMVVSRGIGNSSFPIRFNNRPEVILLTLRVDTSVQ